MDAVERSSIDTPVGLPAEEAGGQVVGDVGDEGDRETLLGLAVNAVPQQVASRGHGRCAVRDVVGDDLMLVDVDRCEPGESGIDNVFHGGDGGGGGGKRRRVHGRRR